MPKPAKARTPAAVRLMRGKAKRKITQGKRVLRDLAALRELKVEVELITAYSTDVIYRLRYDTMRYDYVSPSVLRLLGYTPEEFKNMNLRGLIVETRIVSNGMKPVESFAGLEENRKTGEVGKWQADYRIRTKDGRQIWVSDVSYPWFDKKGAIIGSVGSLRDITDRIRAEDQAREEVKRLTQSDLLTGLAQRHVLFDRLAGELRRIRRTHGDVTLLLIDVDQFRKINDAHGYEAGDAMLRELTGIIISCLRDTDMAARIGGEEFGVVLPDTPAAGAEAVAARIRHAVARHNFTLPRGIKSACTVSIGLSTAHYNDDVDASKLFSKADTKLYLAKHSGRSQLANDEMMQVH